MHLVTVTGVRSPRWLPAVLTWSALLVAGCADAPDPSPAPSPSTPAASVSPTGSVSPAPESPTVSAATGLRLQEETSRLNVPEGPWAPIDDVVTYSSAVGRSDTGEVIALSDRENFATPTTLDEQVRFLTKALPKGALIERQPDVVLDGEPAYYVQWSEKGDSVLQHDIGLDRSGRVIHVHFDLAKDDPVAADAVVASVLASFTWR